MLAMKSNLFDDINTIKEAHNKSRMIYFINDIFSKNIMVLILFVLYVLSCFSFIFLQYCYKDDHIKSNISIVVFLITSFIILCFLNKLIDSHFKNVLGMDKKNKCNSFHQSYLLFINRLKNTDISINKLEIIIEQLAFQNNNIIYSSIYATLFYRITILLLKDCIEKPLSIEPKFAFLIIVSVFILITVFDVLHFILNIKRYKNDDIVKKLKQYVNCKKYEMAE
jgi:hypothetical protein